MESGLQELKFSRYNQKVELSGKLFLYNALTGGYASVDEEYRDNFDKCDFKKLDSMKELAELPNAIINQLMEGGFIIPKNFDEFNVIKSMHYRGRFGANKALTMTLIPTMNCNFRCPYCYEKDKKYPVKKMTTEVMDAIIKYVESRIDSVDHIFVTWYGGEPLLGLHEIRIMQNKLIELASQKDVQVSGMIITNGYGLTKEISDELVQMQIKTAQVTIDGPEEIHNRTRFLKNGEGTYRRIINNLLQANENLEVVIRVNIQKENIKYVPEFVDSLKQVGIDKRNNIKPYFSLVRDYEIDKGYVAHGEGNNRFYFVSASNKEHPVEYAKRKIVESVNKSRWKGFEKLSNSEVFQIYATTSQLLSKLKDSIEFSSVIEDIDSLTELKSEKVQKIIYVHNSEYVDLHKTSPGMQTNAVMEYILHSESTIPLFIDQPEDNIDNEARYAQLTKWIRKQKYNRQIILVTHDANIVINGDAENVIIANHTAEKFQYDYGALEYGDILDNAAIILDGGKIAIHRRIEKYGE